MPLSQSGCKEGNLCDRGLSACFAIMPLSYSTSLDFGDRYAARRDCGKSAGGAHKSVFLG